MSVSVTFDAAASIVQIEAHGVLNLAAIVEIYRRGLRLAADHSARLFLSDYRHARLHLSTVDLVAMPSALVKEASRHGLEVHELKRAIIPPPQPEEIDLFMTVMANQWHPNVRLFASLDEARRWLCG